MINPIDKSLNQKITTKKDIPLFQKMPAEIMDSKMLEKL
jgi:hypothetical protein